MVKDTFSIIPTLVLESEKLSPADKLIFSVLFGFRLTQKCWASNDYISEKTKISIPTVNRSLKTLERYGFISRVTTQTGMIKKREIIISDIEDIGINLSEVRNDPSYDQNDQTHDQNDTTTNQIDHPPMIKMISSDDQNDQSIYNIINNNNIYPKTPCKLPDGTNSELVFMTKEQKLKIQDRFLRLFGEDAQVYLGYAVEALDAYITNNKKARKYKDHYKVLIGWPLEKAQEKFRIDNTHSKIRMQNYLKGKENE